MFPTKAVAIWQHLDDHDHGKLVGSYFMESGAFENIRFHRPQRADRAAVGSDLGGGRIQGARGTELIKNRGMRHLALKVSDVERAKDFYIRVFGMKTVVAAGPRQRVPEFGMRQRRVASRTQLRPGDAQRLDHLGFIVPTIADVEAGYAWAKSIGVEIVHELKHHRDGSVSFYIRDPDGNVIQALYEPTISPQSFS